MTLEAIDIIRHSYHTIDYNYYRPNTDEGLNLCIQFDEWTPHSFVSTIRDANNEIHATWGYFHEMYPNATMSQKINLTTLIKDAWAQWVADMENNSILVMAIDNPFNETRAKMLITGLQNKAAL
jgi:hypothetical protein